MSRIQDIQGKMSYIQDMNDLATHLLLTRHLGAALRTERERLGLTQAALARRAQLHRRRGRLGGSERHCRGQHRDKEHHLDKKAFHRS